MEVQTLDVNENLVKLSSTSSLFPSPLPLVSSSHLLLSQYEKAMLRVYVECCSNLTWCTNPLGCDQILCTENMGSMGTCSKCRWSSCFSCNFPEVRGHSQVHVRQTHTHVSLC